MTPDELKKIMSFLKSRITMGGEKADDPVTVKFDAPDITAMTDAGLDENASRLVLEASWWDEMVNDIVETPDFCEPDDPPEQILMFACDVVMDYLRKRVQI